MNWWDRIDMAERRGGFETDDRRDADNWTTCACGEQDLWIQRDCGGAPTDKHLFRLGVIFSEAIQNDAFVRERSCLSEIEERVSELSKEIEQQ